MAGRAAERLRALSDGETFDYDMVEAVLSEAAKFSAFVLAPLNRVMDREGCRLQEGRVVLLHAPTPVGQATALTTQQCALVLVDRASLAHDIESSAI